MANDKILGLFSSRFESGGLVKDDIYTRSYMQLSTSIEDMDAVTLYY